MIKKLPVLFLTFLLFYSFTLPARANKCGINIGPNYSQIEQVAGMAKTGGWGVSLGSPGNCPNFESLFNKGLNVVIRAYNGGKTFTDVQALGWVATLGKMDTKGQKIYFMPWNEPNHVNEGGGDTAGNQVYEYSQFLKKILQDAGLLGTKVILLSPMVDKLNPTFINNSFFTNPGGKAGFYNLFSGSSINEYDQSNSPYHACTAIDPQNNCKYDKIGIPGSYFALESGIAGTCPNLPCYKDDELTQMLNISWQQKWASDSNFKMFAIFSYDPHRPGNWNIFSAPQVKNFYAINCQPGGVETGSYDQAAFEDWFAENKNQLVSCGGCGYAPSAEFCQAAGQGANEPEIIQTEDSLLCTDFAITYGSTSETQTPISPTPTPSGSVQGIGSGEVTGNLRLEEKYLPSFSGLEKTFTRALERLFPKELKETISIDTTPLKTTAQHFVTGKEGDQITLPEAIPKTEITYPSWWTALLGESKILCGLFNTCPPPKNLAIKIVHGNPESPSAGTNCPTGNIPKTDQIADLSTITDEFRTRTIWEIISQTVTRIINNILHLVTQTQKTAVLEDRTRGKLPGGGTLNTQTDFMNHFIPAGLLPTDENAPLAGESKFVLSAGYQAQAGSEKINYQEQRIVRARYCLQLCSLMPAGTDVAVIDPLCPSCNSKDY